MLVSSFRPGDSTTVPSHVSPLSHLTTSESDAQPIRYGPASGVTEVNDDSAATVWEAGRVVVHCKFKPPARRSSTVETFAHCLAFFLSIISPGQRVPALDIYSVCGVYITRTEGYNYGRFARVRL